MLRFLTNTLFRALSLKLINQLRQQSAVSSSISTRRLRELELTEPIRYKAGDSVELWLNDLLCLNVSTEKNYNSFAGGAPPPSSCDLYYINRDPLFCYHKASEEFLQRVMSLFVASHYKNSPNDLQMLSDAPAHHVFCLLGPVDNTKTELPEIYCVIQVCLEGAISKTSVSSGFSHGQRAAGDLIPWTVAQQFQDNNFPSLSGVRVVRIAVHPNYQSMGYGTRALNLLETYYKGDIPVTDEATDDANGGMNQVTEEEIDLLEEKIKPRKDLPPLLFKLSERRAEKVNWLGTSFGLTSELLRFWKKSGYVPVYLRQTANELTGEHSCIMLKSETSDWLREFFVDFRRRFVNLLSYQFRAYTPSLALNILQNYKGIPNESVGRALTWSEAQLFLTKYDINRLDAYSRNMADYHLVTDLLPSLSRMLFLGQLGEFHLSPAQMAIVLGLGLQSKTVDSLAKELGLPSTQLLGLYNKIIRKYVSHLNRLAEEKYDAEMKRPQPNGNIRVEQPKISLDEELERVERVHEEKSSAGKKAIKSLELDQYKIAAADMELDNALSNTGKRKATEQAPGFDANSKFATKKKKKLEKGNKGKFKKNKRKP